MKTICSFAAILIALFLVAWVVLNLFGVVDRAPDTTAGVLALVGILCAVVNPPALPK